MENTQREFLPAFGRNWALPFYDSFVKLLGGDSARKELIRQAEMDNVENILDIGSGTGTLAVLLKSLFPEVSVTGLDPDPEALGLSRSKAAKAKVTVRFERGFADRLPYSDKSFDRVFSTFMLHHIKDTEKEKTLGEVYRVLIPGGSLHLLDFEAGNHSEKMILDFSRKSGFKVYERVKGKSLALGLLPIGFYRFVK